MKGLAVERILAMRVFGNWKWSTSKRRNAIGVVELKGAVSRIFFKIQTLIPGTKLSET